MQEPMPSSPGSPAFFPGSITISRQMSDSAKQVMPPLSPYIEARILNLEVGQEDLCGNVRYLKEMYQELIGFMEDVKNHGCMLRNGLISNADLSKSYQTAVQFRAELDKLNNEVKDLVQVDADVIKTKDLSPTKESGGTPPQLKTSSVLGNEIISNPLPPHLRRAEKSVPGNDANQEHSDIMAGNDTLVTDSQIDSQVIPMPALTPPASPKHAMQIKMPLAGKLALTTTWMPQYISSLPALSDHIRCNLPEDDMVTFSPEFINKTLNGELWSSGMRFLNGPGPYMLRSRTYYILNPKIEPYLPAAPGNHGAKLTAFFKGCPEEFYNFEDGVSSYENVPMFVETINANGHLRYMYYGNYSQTRWSDRLDYDTMMTRIPDNVKEYWAEELTSSEREDWVTDELKKHFFPKPEYSGCIFAKAGDGDDKASIDADVELNRNQTIARDMWKYIEELRDWDQEASMKTAMIKKDFILSAFQKSDLDELPALRLYWEYLECVDWRRDFYNLLVTLQSRNCDYLE